MAISYGRTDIETPIHADIKETISHGIIVSNLAYLVGKELGLQEEVCYDLAVAGMLHDLGKVRLNFYMNEKVEDEILAVDETRYMRMHPSIGYAILADYDYNQTVLDAVLYHHEHYDGTGYPHNLVGKQIPLVGRIMHVCDIFGALISNRDYREGLDFPTYVRYASRLQIVLRICQQHSYLACTGISIPGFHSLSVSPQFCLYAVQEFQPVIHRLRLSTSP